MNYCHSSYLIHYGIKGQRKGFRRFQNEDGTLTEEGKRRYGKDVRPDLEKYIKEAGLIDRISGKEARDLQRYTTGQRRTIIKYMQTHPQVTFQEADRYETKSSLAKGLGIGLALTALAFAVPKIQSVKAAKHIAAQASVKVPNYGSLLGRNSVQIKGSEWIKMMYGRQNWGAWA